MSKELATQAQKLKIYFEDESIIVIENVEFYRIYINGEYISTVHYLERVQDIEFSIFKGKNYLTNHEDEGLETNGINLRKTISKEKWNIDYKYSYSHNPIVAVDYNGKQVILIRKDKGK